MTSVCERGMVIRAGWLMNEVDPCVVTVEKRVS